MQTGRTTKAAGAVIKACACCGETYDAASWAALPLVGTMHTPADAFGPDETLELRNCPAPCGSTLAVELPASALARAA